MPPLFSSKSKLITKECSQTALSIGDYLAGQINRGVEFGKSRNEAIADFGRGTLLNEKPSDFFFPNWYKLMQLIEATTSTERFQNNKKLVALKVSISGLEALRQLAMQEKMALESEKEALLSRKNKSDTSEQISAVEAALEDNSLRIAELEETGANLLPYIQAQISADTQYAADSYGQAMIGSAPNVLFAGGHPDLAPLKFSKALTLPTWPNGRQKVTFPKDTKLITQGIRSGGHVSLSSDDDGFSMKVQTTFGALAATDAEGNPYQIFINPNTNQLSCVNMASDNFGDFAQALKDETLSPPPLVSTNTLLHFRPSTDSPPTAQIDRHKGRTLQAQVTHETVQLTLPKPLVGKITYTPLNEAQLALLDPERLATAAEDNSSEEAKHSITRTSDDEGIGPSRPESPRQSAGSHDTIHQLLGHSPNSDNPTPNLNDLQDDEGLAPSPPPEEAATDQHETQQQKPDTDPQPDLQENASTGNSLTFFDDHFANDGENSPATKSGENNADNAPNNSGTTVVQPAISPSKPTNRSS